MMTCSCTLNGFLTKTILVYVLSLEALVRWYLFVLYLDYCLLVPIRRRSNYKQIAYSLSGAFFSSRPLKSLDFGAVNVFTCEIIGSRTLDGC